MERWNPDLVNANPEILQLGEVLTLCSADWNLPAPHFPEPDSASPLGSSLKSVTQGVGRTGNRITRLCGRPFSPFPVMMMGLVAQNKW